MIGMLGAMLALQHLQGEPLPNWFGWFVGAFVLAVLVEKAVKAVSVICDEIRWRKEDAEWERRRRS